MLLVWWVRLVSVAGSPVLVLGLGLGLSFAFALGFASFLAFGSLLEWLCKDVCQSDWVLEYLFGCLFEGLVVAHLQCDVPGKCIPGFFDVGESLGVLAGELYEAVDVGVDGVL